MLFLLLAIIMIRFIETTDYLHIFQLDDDVCNLPHSTDPETLLMFFQAANVPPPPYLIHGSPSLHTTPTQSPATVPPVSPLVPPPQKIPQDPIFSSSTPGMTGPIFHPTGFQPGLPMTNTSFVTLTSTATTSTSTSTFRS